MTIEQQRALALASARLRMQETTAASPEERKPYDLMANRPWGTGVMEGLTKFANFAGEKVNDYGAKVLPAELAAGLGAGTKTAIEVGPSMAMGATTGAAAGVGAVKPAMQGIGSWLMKTAVKPTWEDQRSGKAARAISTMLEDGYSPTAGGVNAIRTKAAKLTDETDTALANSASTVDKFAVANRLDPLLREVEKSPLPAAGTAAVQGAKSEFLNHPLSGPTSVLTGRADIPVKLAQEMKRRAYAEMGDSAYGMGLKPAAERDALKAIARGLKEEIETAVPQVAPINAKISELLNAKKVAERRALMQGNNNPVSLGVSLATAANNPLAAVGLYANSSAAVKARLARMLYTGGKGAPEFGGVSGAALAAMLQQDQGE